MTVRPMILFVHYTFPGVVGGVETVIGQHARGLAGHARLAVMAGRGPVGVPGLQAIRIRLLDSLHPQVVAAGRAVVQVPPDDDTEHSFARLTSAIAAAVRPWMTAADRVVLHNVATMSLNLPLVAALHDLAPTLPDRRLVVWVHDLAPAIDPPSPLVTDDPRRLLTRPLPGARYVAVSEQRRVATATALGLPPGEIRVVPNGVDVAGVLRLSRTNAPLVDRLRLADADPLLVLPARLVRRKRIELAIDAARVLRDRGRRARLVVTGGPDPHDVDGVAYLAELRQRVAIAGGHDVLLVDEIRRSADDRLVADLYALADALVLPSASEGFGLPMLEAALARLPIVCSDLPVLHEVVGAGGTFVPLDGDGHAFADAIERTLDASMSAGLATRIRRGSDWSRLVVEQVMPAILD